ncbi:MAG TPA: hypothetical protein VKR31_10240 [Rhizomicrobium sp.]|nr:hypothetical protein [Rhizomicrobium sp.]
MSDTAERLRAAANKDAFTGNDVMAFVPKTLLRQAADELTRLSAPQSVPDGNAPERIDTERILRVALRTSREYDPTVGKLIVELCERVCRADRYDAQPVNELREALEGCVDWYVATFGDETDQEYGEDFPRAIRNARAIVSKARAALSRSRKEGV